MRLEGQEGTEHCSVGYSVVWATPAGVRLATFPTEETEACRVSRSREVSLLVDDGLGWSLVPPSPPLPAASAAWVRALAPGEFQEAAGGRLHQRQTRWFLSLRRRVTLAAGWVRAEGCAGALAAAHVAVGAVTAAAV